MKRKTGSKSPASSNRLRLPIIADHRGDRWPVHRFGVAYRPIELADFEQPTRRGVAACLEWLRSVPKIARTKTFNCDSYQLKHAVEDEAGFYIANGELIVAASMAGFRLEVERLNCEIGISQRWFRVRQLANRR